MTRRTRRAQAERAPEALPGGAIGWRQERLVRAGFDHGLARLLAASNVDLHALIDLVEHGCPPQLAARIVAPLEAEDNYL